MNNGSNEWNQELDDSGNLLLRDPLVKPKLNDLVIYHANCLDGFGAAWVFYRMQNVLEQSFEFVEGVYGEAPPDVTGRTVYLVDFSYKRDVVKAMCKVAHKVILIDHHKTAIEDLAGMADSSSAEECIHNFTWYIDQEHSGCVLAWNYWARMFGAEHSFYMGPMPNLLRHLEDRDLWNFKIPGTAEIHAAVAMRPRVFTEWDNLMHADLEQRQELITQGAMILARDRNLIAAAYKECVRHCNLARHSSAFIPMMQIHPALASDAGAYMARQMAPHMIDYLRVRNSLLTITYHDTEAGRKFSLRSPRNGADVAAIAQLYGGGGHKHAAGFTVSRDHILARS